MTADTQARAREEQRKRANDVLLDIFNGDQAAFSAADVAIVASALDEARIAGMREASEIVQDVPLSPQFDLENGQVVRVCGFAAKAIDARIAELTAPPAEPSP